MTTDMIQVDLGSIEGLVAGLLDAELLGVPADWVVRDVDDGAVAADDGAISAQLDPFLGLLDCPEGTILEVPGRTWVSRRYSAAELPLENGLLSVEIVVEDESPTDAATDRDALGACSVDDFARLTVVDIELESAEYGRLEGVSIELSAAASETIPYPSAFSAVIVNFEGHTVTVVLGGIDRSESWRDLALDIAATAVDRLSADSAPSTSSTSSTSPTTSTP